MIECALYLSSNSNSNVD